MSGGEIEPLFLAFQSKCLMKSKGQLPHKKISGIRVYMGNVRERRGALHSEPEIGIILPIEN